MKTKTKTVYVYEVSRIVADMLRYDYAVKSDGMIAEHGWHVVMGQVPPTVKRWASFGVQVRNVEKRKVQVEQ